MSMFGELQLAAKANNITLRDQILLNALDTIYQLLNQASITNSRFSTIEFTDDAIDPTNTKQLQFAAWITDNPDYEVYKVMQLTSSADGVESIFVMFTGIN